MAVNNTEIEIQVKIEESIFIKLKEFLDQNAKFIKNSIQEDDYYTPIHRDFIKSQYPYEWLRIGKRGDKTILTYKHYYPEDSEINTHCDEYETVVEKKEQLEKIFDVLNLKKLITVRKSRYTYEYNGEFEISLDIVDELGTYVEIEVIKDFGSIGEGVKKLYEFANQFGMDTTKRDNRGYPMRLLINKGLVLMEEN